MSSLTHREYFLLGAKFKKQIEDLVASRNRFHRHVKAMVKKYGAQEAVTTETANSGRKLIGLQFDKDSLPDLKVWKKVDADHLKFVYWPRLNTKLGKEINTDLREDGRWDAEEIRKAVGYPSLLMVGDRFFFFNAGINFKTKQVVFAVPLLPDGVEKPKDWYEPVPGIKKVSFAKMEQILK